MSEQHDPAAPCPTPPWRITRGNPTPEETAALTAVLTALLAHHTARPAPPGDRTTHTGWDRGHHSPRPPTGTWRAR